MFAQCIGQPCDDHEQDDEQIVVSHLYVIGIHFESREDSRNQKTPQIFAPIGQNKAANHRRQIRKGHHSPKVSGGNDDEEVTGERPDDGAQSGHIVAEIESTKQNIEPKEVDKHIPNVLGKP